MGFMRWIIPFFTIACAPEFDLPLYCSCLELFDFISENGVPACETQSRLELIL